ncbi:hypothetical protein ACH5RR_025436 [Cinchona calisaya]|uniref:Di19 C-terminal domain-containing protein n=1 Tax=Cinchona calisaya TaxID=153742 RepID=A0ABD2Z0Q9_9GENT
MAVDFWAAKVHSAKHISAVQAARLNNSGRWWLSGLYDYLQIFIKRESHLTMDDEGEDDVRACFPCPFCSVEFLMLIQNEPAPDPLLSPFLCSATFSDPKDYKQDVSCTFADSSANAESIKPTMSDAVQEQDYEERMQRPAFFQEVIMSTIF